jgi:hypothetical protein
MVAHVKRYWYVHITHVGDAELSDASPNAPGMMYAYHTCKATVPNSSKVHLAQYIGVVSRHSRPSMATTFHGDALALTLGAASTRSLPGPRISNHARAATCRTPA